MKNPKRLVALSIFFATLAMAEASSREDNFNPRAGGGNGAANANCNSALILFCDEGDAPSGAPGPVLGGAAGILFALGAGWVAYRNRRRTSI